MAKATRRVSRKRRHLRVRRKLFGTADRPRLNVYRSIAHIYAQVIDDQSGRTLVSASTLDRELRGDLAELSAVERAKRIGIAIAARAKEAGIQTVVFDRGGFPYHGQVRAVAEGSREGGLEF